MGEEAEIFYIPRTPERPHKPLVPGSPSPTESPYIEPILLRTEISVTWPASPMMMNMVRGELDPQDAWLPITESRNGNACYSVFHTLSSGIGFQALLLPVAFAALGCSNMQRKPQPQVVISQHIHSLASNSSIEGTAIVVHLMSPRARRHVDFFNCLGE